MIYIRVAPNARLPMNRDELTYTVRPEDLPFIHVGQIVRVRVHGQKTWGVVTALSRHKPRDVARFSEIDRALPVRVPETLIQEARILRRELWHPLGFCFAAMLPPIASRYPKQPDTTTGVPKGKTVPRVFTLTGSPKERWQQYHALIGRAMKQGQSIIVSFAQRTHAEAFIDSSPQHAVRWDADVKTSQRWKNWLAVQQPKSHLVVGLRTAVFAPAYNLGLIIVDSPRGRGHKSDQAPYYATNDVAIARKSIEGCSVVYADELPTFTSEKSTAIRSMNHLAPIELVAKDSTPAILRSQSEAWIREHATDENRLFILVNRVGSGFYRCQTCSELIRCERCKRIPSVERGKLRCTSCGWKGVVPAFCPSCKSTNIQTRGIGTESVVKALRSIVETSVYVVDRNTTELPTTKHGVIVGTEFALPFLATHQPTHTLLLGIDEMHARSSIDANDHAIRLVAELAALTETVLAMETDDVEDEWIQSLKQRDFGSLLRQELTDRKTFDYPPFGRLVMFRSEDSAQLAQIASSLENSPIRLFAQSKSIRGSGFRMIGKVNRLTSLEALLRPLEEKKLLNRTTIEVNPISESFD